ncbi:unnamed protein product [Linum trigynum]
MAREWKGAVEPPSGAPATIAEGAGAGELCTAKEDEDDGVDNTAEPRQSWEQVELTGDGKIKGGDLVTLTAAIKQPTPTTDETMDLEEWLEQPASPIEAVTGGAAVQVDRAEEDAPRGWAAPTEAEKEVVDADAGEH